jgi:hypothetical protein
MLFALGVTQLQIKSYRKPDVKQAVSLFVWCRAAFRAAAVSTGDQPVLLFNCVTPTALTFLIFQILL